MRKGKDSIQSHYCHLVAHIVRRPNATDNHRRSLRSMMDGLALGLLAALAGETTWSLVQRKKVFQAMRAGFVHAYGGEHQARRYRLSERTTWIALQKVLGLDEQGRASEDDAPVIDFAVLMTRPFAPSYKTSRAYEYAPFSL